jgi:hypothetical protein
MRFGERIPCQRCHGKFFPKGSGTFAVCPRCQRKSKRQQGRQRAQTTGHRHVAATPSDFHPSRGDVPGWDPVVAAGDAAACQFPLRVCGLREVGGLCSVPGDCPVVL